MRQSGNGLVEVDPAQTSETEIPQKCSHGSNQFPGSAIPTLIGAIEQERPYLLRIPLTEILAQCVKQVGGAATILSEGGFYRAAVLLKPFAE
jgi:hypothetical protein